MAVVPVVVLKARTVDSVVLLWAKVAHLRVALPAGPVGPVGPVASVRKAGLLVDPVARAASVRRADLPVAPEGRARECAVVRAVAWSWA